MAVFTTALIFVLFFVFLIQPITVRVKRGDETVIYTDFLFFTLILYPERRKISKSSSKKRNSKKFSRTLSIYRAISYAAKHSEVTIYTLPTEYKSDAPSRDVLTNEYLSYGWYILIALFSTYAKKLTVRDRVQENSEDVTLDISFDTALYNLLFFTLKYRKGAKTEKRST